MNKRGIWVVLTALLVIAAVAAGVILYPQLTAKPVSVYPVSLISYTGKDPGMAESYGVVTADKVQSIYVTETQKVNRIYVYDGQEVKKGDLLYSYDTTLTDLALDRKDLSIQQMEINLKTAREELKRLNAMKPMVVTTPPVTETGKAPANAGLLGAVYEGNGTAARPYKYWLSDGAGITEDMVWDLFALDSRADIYVIFQSVTGDVPGGEFTREFGARFTITFIQPTTPGNPTTPTEPAGGDNELPIAGVGQISTASENELPEVDIEEEPDVTEPPAMPRKSYTLRFFDPHGDEIGTQIDWNSGYTQSELTAMREQKATEIRELEFAIRIGKAELAIMRKEATDGNVTADFDGVVASVLNPGSAETLNQPMIKVTGGGGYYVEGTVSETDRDTIQVGMAVTVSNWGTGTSYSGTVSWVGSYPVESVDSTGAESGVTYYPYRVFVDEQANLQEGAYVSMICHSGKENAKTLYVENAFLLTEGKDCYAYVRNEEGKLEKRLLKTGVSTDGYSTPVYAGLTSADYVAFPYDRDIREGAETVFSSADGLYGW